MVTDEIKRLTGSKTVGIVLLFVVAVLLILYIFPSNAKFEYQYEKRGVWSKDALIAPREFMIYKSDEALKAETDSLVKKKFQPIFAIDDAEREKAISKLNSKTVNGITEVADNYTKHIKTQIFNIYQKGIMNAEYYDRFKDSVKTIRVRNGDGKVAIEVPLAQIYTPKSAYEKILKSAPASLDKDILKAYDLDRMLNSNLVYDEAMSENSRKDLIAKNISVTKGIVQEGEIIVAHGGVITPDVYDKLTSLKRAIEQNDSDNSAYYVKAGQLVIVVISLFTFYFYLTLFRKKFVAEIKNVVFMLMLVVAMCWLTSFVVTHAPHYIYIVPYALLPIMVTTFFDTRTALFMHNTTVLICSFIVHEGVEFLLMQVIVGMVTICSLKTIYERAQLVRTAGILLVVYCSIYIGSTFIYSSKLTQLEWSEFMENMLPFVLNAALLLFAFPLIYIVEKVFNYVSDVTLVELANTNNQLLRQFSEATQGTFEHCMRVSNLADAAAHAIEANPMLVRIGALYHDIGKMQNPIYFTENQNGVNPHDAMDNEEESARIIIRHVTDGIEIAKKHGLPLKVQDFIRTHHGCSQAKYFYIKAKNKNPEKEIDPMVFTYPGPLPNSKETAILMMCDAVEAASRSLKEYTEENITNLVNKIIDGQVADGQFKDAPITFRNIETVKKTLIEKLKSLYHTRISYPEMKK